MKHIITLLTILFLLTACSNDNDNNDSGGSAVEFTLIGQRDLSPSQEKAIPKTNFVIKNSQSWNSFISKITINNDETPFFTETNIDFSKYQVIAAVDQVRLYGGYSIDITSIKENQNTLIVTIEQLKPGGLMTQITQPYHIVKIAKSSKKVVFK